jgi:hypothetical protein
MQRIAMILVLLGAAAAVAMTGGCKTPPNQTEMQAYEYGPRPENYEKLIRDYLWPKLLDPGNAIVEFKAGPKQLTSNPARALQYGCRVCVDQRQEHERRLRRPLPDGVFIRMENVAMNGGRTTTSSFATRAPMDNWRAVQTR